MGCFPIYPKFPGITNCGEIFSKKNKKFVFFLKITDKSVKNALMQNQEQAK